MGEDVFALECSDYQVLDKFSKKIKFKLKISDWEISIKFILLKTFYIVYSV